MHWRNSSDVPDRFNDAFNPHDADDRCANAEQFFVIVPAPPSTKFFSAFV